MSEKWTARRLRDLKGKTPIVCLTAYDYATARLIDDSGLHLVLVGDSLAQTMLGYDTTLPVTLAEMLHHTRAVVRGVSSALVVADMPFMTYQTSVEQGLANAGRFIKKAGADAVKIEGGALRAPLVKALVQNGIPVLGHLGLTPQSIRELGSYHVQGRRPEEVEQLIQDARALTDAGCFAVVLECVPAALGRQITESIAIPTIGIGAGPDCDGQVLVTHDVLGLLPGNAPRFVKQYAAIGEQMRNAFAAYRDDVTARRFPGPDHSY